VKIAIVCSYYPWPPSVGGVETIVRNVSMELAKRGHEVHVITTPFDVTTGRQVSGFGVEEKDGVIIHKLRPGKLKVGYGRFLKGLKDIVNRTKPEVVHSHHLHPHTLQLASWKDELNYSLIVELHHPIVSLEKLSAKIAFPLAFYLLKRRANNIDSFIAHTELEKRWLEDKGVHSDKISIVRFPAIPQKLLGSHSHYTCSDENYLLFLGRLTWVKGIHILIKAFKYVKDIEPDLRLKLAGPPDPGYERCLRNLVESLHLKSSVDFLGPIHGDEKYCIIKCSRILVLPSFKEYTPSVLLEAQALGVPVIATRVGAVSEMVLDGETGLLVKAGDPYELAKSIATLIENEDLRRRFSVKAREFAKNFTVERSVKKLEGLYYCILNKSSAVETSG
jgi:glycosyltransferase involved in cell wall biosynthesis